MIEVQKDLEGQSVDGRYPLAEFLGTTQHSSVFRTDCEDAPNGRAAIKLIPAPAATSGAQLTRWRLAARFSHPALLRIFDMGRCDFEGRPMLYVVMELAEENLAEIVPVRCLSAGEADAMLGPALDALAYLHGKGFVHGRLQPSNILAIGDRLKLSSDSIARIGEAAGIRDPLDPYCAPEASLSAASDIWSLGVTLVQCLAGRLPERLPGGQNSVAVPPEVPAPFLDLGRHCLNAVPQRRWSVSQLQFALGRDAAAEPPAQLKIPAAEAEPAVVPARAASAFSKPDAAAPLRRRFRIEKKYRLALAGVAAAVAAFVLGIVISGGSSDTNITASAPVAASAGMSRLTASANGSLRPASAESRHREFATNSAAPLKSKNESSISKSRRELPPSARRPHSDNPGVAMIVSSAAPAAQGDAANSVTQLHRPATRAAVAPSASSASGGVIPGAVSLRAVPRVPAKASSTVTGTVRVSVIVDVDPRGHVVEAKPDSPGPSRYFAGLSMAAAKDWKFTPPRVDGNVVPSEWVINFGYSNSGASANASERHP
ncbi:MAG: protein kinase domain-containing protein [Candidatus Acidiferrales bacterium]